MTDVLKQYESAGVSPEVQAQLDELAAIKRAQAMAARQSRPLFFPSFNAKKDFEAAKKVEFETMIVNGASKELKDVFVQLDPGKKGGSGGKQGELVGALVEKVKSIMNSLEYPFDVEMYHSNFFGTSRHGATATYTDKDNQTGHHRLTFVVTYPTAYIGVQTDAAGNIVNALTFKTGMHENDPVTIRLTFHRAMLGL